MANVVLENLWKTYPGDVVAVQDVNLEIRDREFVVLVGPSGCGKSTTLRMIAGLEEITKGNIYIDGVKVNGVAPKNRDIAMVFQNYALYPHMSVYKNMAFGLQLRRFPKAEIRKRVYEAAEILGIELLLERKPRALSGGQRQRVAVGRAIVRKPKAFLFDEPLSNLDAKMRVQMRTEISKLHTRLQSTMIYVTHDQVEAMTMGDRIVVMNEGIIQQVAPPIKLYDYPANQFVAGFIGSPAMNFFSGGIVLDGGGLYFEEQNFRVRIDDSQELQLRPYAGRPVLFGLRPEGFRFARHAPDIPVENIVKARVEVVEPMGADSIIYLNAGSDQFVIRVDSHEDAETGDVVDLALYMDKARFFDRETTNSIT